MAITPEENRLPALATQLEQGLLLTTREAVETAWQAAAITGLAPTIEPALQAALDLNAVLNTPDEDIALAFSGEFGQRAKQEIITSLEAVTENLDEQSNTVKSALALLAILQTD